MSTERHEHIQRLSPEQRARLFQRLREQALNAAAGTGIRPRTQPEKRQLSFAQQRLWFLDQMAPGNPAYNISGALRISGPLDADTLDRCLAAIVRRHEVLRTTFTCVDGTPVATSHPDVTAPLYVNDLRALEHDDRAAAVERAIATEAAWNFDLARGPLLRATLLVLGAQEHVLILTIHHIVADGWSIGVFFRELGQLYQHGAAPLPDLPIQYADYAAWQREWVQSEAFASHRAYWKQQLGGAPPPLQLPTDRSRPAIRTFRGASVSETLPLPLSQQLLTIGRSQGATLFMVLLATFTILLARQSGQEDIAIGTPVANRTRSEIEGLIGCFINILVLRTSLADSPTFRELLARVRDVCLGAYSHQEAPVEWLIEDLQPERDLSRPPLFQVLFNMPDIGPPITLPGCAIELVEAPQADSKFDMTLYAREHRGGIDLECVYNADIFDRRRMADLLGQLRQLLAQVAAHPDERVDRFSLVTPAAAAVLPQPSVELQGGCASALVARFARQARLAPQHTALVDRQGHWSYHDLDQLSGRLAGALLASGVRSQEIVAVYAHRSAALILALLGVIKAGAAFSIVNPAHPPAYQRACLEAAMPHAWLQVAAAGEPPEQVEAYLAARTLRYRTTLPGSPAAAAALLRDSPAAPSDNGAVVGPDDLAYLAFTSGTTGAPKAIAGTHRPIAHFLQWHSSTFDFSRTDRFSMLSGLMHDPLLRDIFTPLWVGATLHIPDPADMQSPDRLQAWMRQSRITAAHLTPALAQILTEGAAAPGPPPRTLPDLRYAFLGGDVVSRHIVERLRSLAPDITCVNFYGATETPQAMGWYIVPPATEAESERPTMQTLPIGTGIADVQLLVLNTAQQLAGIGEVGEIYVRTPYLTLGYPDDPERTRRCFVENPWRAAPGDRMYRTGDLGRYLPNGDIAFCGRADNQIKIRGFRVEPAMIEAILLEHPHISRCAVVARDTAGGDKRLVAYVVPTEEPQPPAGVGDHVQPPVGQPSLAAELRRFLAERLPTVMLPSAVVTIDALPLSPNGKLDWRALPEPGGERPDLETIYVPPQTSLEQAIAAVWQEALAVQRVGIHDNFFDLGGHSLLIVQVQSRLHERLGRNVSIIDLFRCPTIHGLASHLAQQPEHSPSAQQVHERAQRQREYMRRKAERRR